MNGVERLPSNQVTTRQLSSLCRGGFLTVEGPDAHRAALAHLAHVGGP